VLGLVPTVVGCGADIADDPVGGSPAALTQGASYLVSFTSGGIPANADALVATAGGSIVARYAGAGAVLARSTDAGFAARLRTASGIEAVGAVSAISSRLDRVKVASAAHQPHQPLAAGGDPLSVRQWDMDQIRAPQARAVSVGKKSVLVGV